MTSMELGRLFGGTTNHVSDDVASELLTIMRIHSLSEQELFYKWEAYSIKMGSESTDINSKMVKDFRKDLQDALERESRGKAHVNSTTKKNNTPRPTNTGDVYQV